ncbi:MAG: hypothetical protein E6J41_14280 [Chloroflexi bacterium]|nr:MAG: hypothetical protein E6J41_14280 [Chloroflexota bacterium]
MSVDPAEREALFWRLAERLLADPAVTRSTMMGLPCLRAGGSFFASLERATGNLIVKLPRARVQELVGTGAGVAFAPNRRVFREWVAMPAPDPEAWSGLLAEARAFVDA